jgi:hypothetical protein
VTGVQMQISFVGFHHGTRNLMPLCANCLACTA